jgi:hypothetical protein
MIAATGTRNSVDFWVLSQDAGAGQPRKKPRQRSERCGDEDPVAHLRASTSLLGHTRKSLTTQTWSAFHPPADVSSAARAMKGHALHNYFEKKNSNRIHGILWRRSRPQHHKRPHTADRTTTTLELTRNEQLRFGVSLLRELGRIMPQRIKHMLDHLREAPE